MNKSVKNLVSRSEPIYTLGTASKLSGISVHSIRQYVDNGLIIPYTTKSNRHLFSQVDIIRLITIKEKLSKMGLNIGGIKAMYSLIPCWLIHPCAPESRERCEAYYSDKLPCWDASNKGKECKNEDCRECDVYNYLDDNSNIKSLLHRFKN